MKVFAGLPMLKAHDRLGDFEIIRLLGKGGMGEVYEARQLNPDRLVALKVLAPWLADDEDSLRRFFQESGVPAKLDHPNIVRIITTGQTPDGVAYFTMHLVRGISLSEMIKHSNASASSELPTRTVESKAAADSSSSADVSLQAPTTARTDETNPPLARDYRRDRFNTVARIGIQAARALAYAHLQSHLHRDIKPSNLMIDHHDHVYLVDFGLTRSLGPDSGSTNPGTVIGTPWYMSPEQAEGKVIDARSDIYSLGVTLYELATQGLGPFTASRDDKPNVIAQVRAGQTLPLRTLAPGIPAALERIIVKAMQLKPSKRYANATEMLKDLEAFLGVSGKGEAHAATKYEGSVGKRWPIVVAIGVVLAVGVAVAAVVIPDRIPKDKVEAVNGGMRKLDGSKAMPESLRNGLVNVPINLLRNNSEAIWHETVLGKAKPVPHFGGQGMSLFARPTDLRAITLLADPDRPSFEFKIDVERLNPTGRIVNECGLIFGWRRDLADTLGPARFFVVEIHEVADGDQKVDLLRFRSAKLIKHGNGLVTEEWGGFIGDQTIFLGKKERYHPITVTVHRDRASVAVPHQAPVHFDLLQMQRQFPNADKLSTLGAVGIWSRMGQGLYKNASITYLEPQLE